MAVPVRLADAIMQAHVKAHSGTPEIVGQLHLLYFAGFRMQPAELVHELRRTEHHALDLAAKITRAREEAERAAGMPVTAPAGPVRGIHPAARRRALPPTFRPIGAAAGAVVERLARGEEQP